MQGGANRHLRRGIRTKLIKIGFDGLPSAVAVGESKDVMREVVGYTAAALPDDAPRFLWVLAADIVDAVERICLIVFCRLATDATEMFCSDGVLKLRNAKCRGSDKPPDDDCDCLVCRRFSRAYLHHLFAAGDALGGRLAALHNLAFYRRLMANLRAGVIGGTFAEVARRVREVYP